jgi:flavodoxin
MPTNLPAIGRRSVLRSTVAGLAGALAATGTTSCGTGSPDTKPSENTTRSPSVQGTASSPDSGGRDKGGRVLLAYFSRDGENYYYGGRTDLDIGNTEVLAGMIGTLITCDVHRIEAAEPYPDGYDATVARNVREQNADARPAIAAPLASIDQYDTVLLASGIWNVRAPMIMTTFAESYDFTGKTVHPVTTYAMSGLGTTGQDYADSCPGAAIGEGLAVRGEEVRDAVADIEAWLRRTGLLQS